MVFKCLIFLDLINKFFFKFYEIIFYLYLDFIESTKFKEISYSKTFQVM